MTIVTALLQGTQLLEDEAIAFPRFSAEILLTHALQRERSYVDAHPEEELSEIARIHYDAYLQERLKGKPTQYITGHQEFYGRDFLVTSGVLIPRPETEHLVNAALARIRPGDLVADVGTGSGAIAITLALETGAQTYAIDISTAALSVAQMNARRLSAPVGFLAGDLVDALGDRSVNVLVSNPPYIPEFYLPSLPREVRGYEPHSALFPGPTGLELYARLIADAARVLRPAGWLLLELGFNTLGPLRMVLRHSWHEITPISDPAGYPRVIAARLLS